MKKKYRLKEWVKDLLTMVLFYGLIIGGIILVNYRFEHLNNVNEVVEYGK